MLEKTMTRLAPLHTGPARDVATRDAYGQALLELGKERPGLVVLDSDLSGSTKTKAFSQAFPDRFFNMGVAEANMMGTAAGLAAMGRTVFASSFAMFAAGKAWEQVRQTICVPHLSVNICATHAGLTVGEDGKSHQMLEDVALMRVLPEMTVIVPADGVEAAAAVRAVADHDGPCYVRLSRAKTPLVFDAAEFRFTIGRGSLLREGTDLALVANGVVVAMALAAAAELAREGIHVRVIDMACVKPIDEELLVEAAVECGAVLTAEEHQVQGGLGSAVAEVLARRAPVPMDFAGVQGTFGESGTAEELLVKYGLDGPSLAKRARVLLARKHDGTRRAR